MLQKSLVIKVRYTFWKKVWCLGGWVDGWMGAKAILRNAYSNQKLNFENCLA